MLNYAKATVVVLLLGGCSRGGEPRPDTTQETPAPTGEMKLDTTHTDHTEPPLDTGAARGSMAGMDHGVLNRSAKPASGASMEGHDMGSAGGARAGNAAPTHEGMRMPAGSPSRGASAVDHSQMNMRPGTAARTDHANMPEMSTTRAAPVMAGMQHGAPQPATSADDSTTEKLRQLARALMRDPAVLRHIESNDSLRLAWLNPSVQQLLRRN